MVPHSLVGKNLVLRVKNGIIRIYNDNVHIVTYDIPIQKGQFLFKQQFIDALKQDREMNQRKYGRGIVYRKGRAGTLSPTIPAWAVEVETRPLNVYDLLQEQEARHCGEVVV
jgi:hypothetical protein